jgi:hypothetical protein
MTRAMHVDDSHWPVVLGTYDGQQTDDDVEHYIRRMDEMYARRQAFVALTIVRAYAGNFAHVKRLGAWTKANSEASGEWCKGGAVVLPSSAARFLISSFFLVFVPPFPLVAFDDVAPAVAWVRKRLVVVGLPVPPSLSVLEAGPGPAHPPRGRA